MEAIENIFAVMTVFIAVTSTITAVTMYVVTRIYFMLKNHYNAIMLVNERLKIENENLTNRHSDELLTCLRNVTMEITVIKFREYIDNHEVKLITKENIKNLASDVAKEVYGALRKDRLQELTRETLLTYEFYTTYIIHISINAVKQLIEKEIEKIVDNQ